LFSPSSAGGIIPESKPRGHVEFSNVTFAYPSRSDVPVLNCLNLSIPAGAMTAVVGGSGSGKSTIASFLLRFYYPLSGQILFDGYSVKELDWTWLRKNVALVSQVRNSSRRVLTKSGVMIRSCSVHLCNILFPHSRNQVFFLAQSVTI